MARSAMTTLVGRRSEVAALTDALTRARAGHPTAVLLGGDAGVGKTRLVSRLAEQAGRDGATVVVTHCVDLGEVGLPYLPFAEALTQLSAGPATADVVAQVAATRPSLTRLLPALGGLPPTDDEGSRLQLFDGIAAVLAATGRADAPLVLVLEDLHWADSSTRDVLRFLVARMRSEHLLLVGTYRSDDLHRRHPLRPVLGELVRHPRVERLDLAPFTAGELQEFGELVSGGRLDPGVLRGVLERSEGNAYFAEELLEADDGELPWSLTDVLRSRLDRADPAAQRLARVASVAGRRVAEPLLRAVWHRVGGEVGPAPFDDVLREAFAAHVLAAEDDRVAFRHALLAEVVYADLLPGEQAALHRTYLDAMTTDGALGSPAQRAHHAQRAHDPALALTASIEAADEAARVLAPDEELTHLETALGLWEAVPDAAERAGRSRLDVIDAAAAAAARAGRAGRATSLARLGVESAAADPRRLPALRVRLVQSLIAVDDVDEALVVAQRALAELPDDATPHDRAWTLATHARTCLILDRDEEASAHAQEAVDVARRFGEAGAEADALATLAVLVVDDPDAAAQALDTARRRARDAGDLVTEQRCAYNVVTTQYYAGRLDAAAEAAEAAIERSRAAGLTWSEFGHGLRFFQELIRYCRGDLSPTTDELVAASGHPLMATVQLYAAAARGDADTIDRGRSLESVWEKDPQVALISGGCTIDALTGAGRAGEAVELAERLIDHLGRSWSDYFLGAIWLAALGLAALADLAAVDRLAGKDVTGFLATGDRLLDRATSSAERGRPRGGRLGPEGRAWLARVHAEHARLHGRSDVGLWDAATEAFGYGHRYEAARSRRRTAEALLGAGDRERARVEASAALTEARALGAGPLAEEVAALGRRGRLDLPGERTATDLLTARESEVLRLVAEGLSNRQIGERLFISGKTVSVHVSNLLAKLEVSSRTEAVSVAHRRGLAAVHRP